MRKFMLPVVVGMLAMAWAPAHGQIFLGPPDSGAASGGSHWMAGMNGAGYTVIDSDDAPAGGYDLTISNTVAGRGNNGDWRCPPFSLGAAAGGARPITFSFAYKLLGKVATGNNIHVQLRFFDAAGTNFLAENVFLVGAHRSDSKMTDYRTLKIENIYAPPRAGTADIWIDANIFEPWVSGTARFANFSVTTAPRSLMFKAAVIALVMSGICALAALWIHRGRRRASINR